MTWNLAQAMNMIKAAGHKYTHRKLVGKDPKTGRKRYRYYYAEHHGGGITGAAFEAGAAFKLTFKGRRGHFHVQRVEGDKVFVKHDGRPGSKEVEMSQDELRALLERQHSKAETKSREKAQANRRKGRKSTAKKRKSTKRKKTQTQTPREQLTETAQQSDENFETMPDEPRNLKTARRELKEKEEILAGSKRAGTSADKIAEIEGELSDKRAKVEVLEEDHFSNVFADKLRSSAESAKGKQLIDALAEAHEKREGVEGAERALIDFYKETALKRKGSPERLKDREFKDLRNIKNRWLESDEDTLYDSLKEQETEARQIYLEHASAGGSSPYTQAQVDTAVQRQAERGARAAALKFAYTEGMLRTAQELKTQDETTQQAPQRSQTARAFSGMVDAIKSGDKGASAQAAQSAFKAELNKVIDKAESGALTATERAELLPIAEQLVAATSGRARGLMTAVRDQIKGSST